MIPLDQGEGLVELPVVIDLIDVARSVAKTDRTTGDADVR
jgi:hypothetical protein